MKKLLVCRHGEECDIDEFRVTGKIFTAKSVAELEQLVPRLQAVVEGDKEVQMFTSTAARCIETSKFFSGTGVTAVEMEALAEEEKFDAVVQLMENSAPDACIILVTHQPIAGLIFNWLCRHRGFSPQFLQFWPARAFLFEMDTKQYRQL